MDHKSPPEGTLGPQPTTSHGSEPFPRNSKFSVFECVSGTFAQLIIFEYVDIPFPEN